MRMAAAHNLEPNTNSAEENNTAFAVANAANDAIILKQRNCDPSYRNEWNRFTKWVDGQPELEGPPYLKRTNIDHYYTIVVAKRRGTRNHIGRVCNAMNWFAKNNVTERNALHGTHFVEKNDVVLRALEAQGAFNASVGGTGNPGADPQKGLKDNLCLPDRIRIMKYVYANRDDWGSCIVNLAWGQNGAIRGASNRKLTYADLKISHGYGAEESGPLARSLILVLRKGDVHKNRSDRDHQVSCWRHKNYVLCSIFATAAHVIWSLVNNTTLNFYKPHKTKPADWWSTPLIDWNQYSEASNAMKCIFSNLNLDPCKLTHFRTWAVQNGGFLGLRPDQINTMTDHKIEKQMSAYGPVAEYMSCSVMAGFVKGEPYHNDRAKLQLPHGTDWYVKKLLPCMSEYKRQHESPLGDKTDMCKRFLFEMIPWFVEVLIQDGIYFVIDFPNHVLSRYLKVSRSH